MAQQILVSLEASRDRVRKAFATVETAENKLRNTRISALSECYTFALECFLDREAFELLCDDAGVKKGHEGTSPYLRVVKLVYGGENAASRQLQSKYAKVLDYAEFHGITANSITNWLKKMSMENRMNDARGDIKYLEHLGRFADAEEVQKQSEAAFQAAESKTKAVLGSTNIQIDMNAEGAPSARLHHLAVKVAEDGSVEIVGFTNDSEEAVERSIGRSYKPKKDPKKPWIETHPLGGLLKAISILSGSVASSVKIRKSENSVKTTPAYFTFSNTEKDCSVLVSQLGVGAAPIAKARIPAIGELPIGTFILTPENAKKLYNAARTNPELKVEVSEGSGRVDSDRLICEPAWNIDPLRGVIGVQY